MHGKSFWSYWGKARPDDSSEDYHPLVYHSLDVAATGAIFLEQSPALVDEFCTQLNCSREAFLSWAAFFLALHDLGKFSNTFQLQRHDLVRRLQGREAQAVSYSERHDTLGYWVWSQVVQDGLLERLGLHGDVGDINNWMRAVCGHHGMPPRESGNAHHHFREADSAAVSEFIEAMAQLLLTEEAKAIPVSDREDFYEVSQDLSWWFAGLAVLADWLGSNTTFFKYCTKPRVLDDYWVDACNAATEALAVSGVSPVPVAQGKEITDFFPYIRDLSPLQAWAQSVALPDTPQLYLLEDVTGAGKTEAAMILAYRLMAQGTAQGFFVGLPTMATANAMYGRLSKIYQKLYAGHASMALGHGFKELVDLFAKSVLPPDDVENDEAQRDDTASARCTAWLADHNKRVLLAPAGVGTVDQALLAVLHSKHQSLRLLGLFNKVLVIDEVHACDAYMEGILKTLLRFHASMGGSAILLSATLPNKMKTTLLNAYAKGRKSTRRLPLLKAAYPLATRWCESDATLLQDELSSRADVSRTVQVRYVADEQLIYQDILAALKAGRCVGWIRNTVADAMKAYAFLVNHIEPEKIILFHARFALGDRLSTEEKILKHFGEKSGALERGGYLMISTQVAEQSLDVDFDVLVSDLAPIDRILQRAGRAHRHTRAANGERLREKDARDKRPRPCLCVLGPPWTVTPNAHWYADTFKTAQYVYNRPDQLWLTAKALQQGTFTMPADARRLIEMVFGGEEVFPDALQDESGKAAGESMAHASQAQMNSLRFESGYIRGEVGDWWADTKTPSRLGEETKEVMLARWDGDTLKRWHDGPWPHSMVKLAARLIDRIEMPADSAYRHAYEQLQKTLPSEGKYCVLFPLLLKQDGIWRCQAWTRAGDKDKQPARLQTWCYDTRLGLRIEESGAHVVAPN